MPLARSSSSGVVLAAFASPVLGALAGGCSATDPNRSGALFSIAISGGDHFPACTWAETDLASGTGTDEGLFVGTGGGGAFPPSCTLPVPAVWLGPYFDTVGIGDFTGMGFAVEGEPLW